MPQRNVVVNPPRVLVRRQQEADQVLDQIRQEELVVENNLTNIVERIMTRNGMNTMPRPTYSSPLSEYILQTKKPRGWKIPKYTKFGGETGESTVEHIARYLTESGDMANNEGLRIKHFPSSLTKAAFTWFTTLPPNSIDNWSTLEKMFHEQFYEGHSKISLVELSSIKRKFAETIDDYLNRFGSLKARCFTQVPEHELVQMAAGGLDYSIRKKIYPTSVKSMSQLADRVRHLERLRIEKVRHTKAKSKKEKVAYVDFDNTDPIYAVDYMSPTEADVDVAEFKSGPAYECKLLFPAKGKSPTIETSSRTPAKTYTFDVSKCEDIFDLLVKDGQILVPPNAKLPPLEQRQKRGFCKYHNYLGHTTSQCFLFRDLVQKSLQEGRLKFAAKKQKIDTDPLRQEEALFAEPVDINMVDITEVPDNTMLEESTDESPNVKLADVYQRDNEDLLGFLYRCKNKGAQVGLCPRCSALTNRVAAENFQKLQLERGRVQWNKRDLRKSSQFRPKTFVLSAAVPKGIWL